MEEYGKGGWAERFFKSLVNYLIVLLPKFFNVRDGSIASNNPTKLKCNCINYITRPDLWKLKNRFSFVNRFAP
jgi:hypothetical protein